MLYEVITFELVLLTFNCRAAQGEFTGFICSHLAVLADKSGIINSVQDILVRKKLAGRQIAWRVYIPPAVRGKEDRVMVAAIKTGVKADTKGHGQFAVIDKLYLLLNMLGVKFVGKAQGEIMRVYFACGVSESNGYLRICFV